MSCQNPASVLVKTIKGWVYTCSFCLMNGHWLVDVNAEKRKVEHWVSCECSCNN